MNGIHEVAGSIPASSTKILNNLRRRRGPLKPQRVNGGSVVARPGHRHLLGAVPGGDAGQTGDLRPVA